MAFNLISRNQDDHVKNIAFLKDRAGQWSLSPGFDITWSFNPTGDWTATHQMSVNGKRDQLTRADLLAVGRSAQLKPRCRRTAAAGFRQATASMCCSSDTICFHVLLVRYGENKQKDSVFRLQ
jgi:serine/threonine-protein kinase HipA